MRSALLSLSKSKGANDLAKRYGLRFGAQRFVAGETIDSAIAKVRQLNDSGLKVTLDHLGEFVSDRNEARESADYCLRTLDAIAQSGVTANLSLKLTQLGLDIDRELCLGHMKEILERARSHGNFVRIDMEDHTRCQVTIDLLLQLREQFDNVGTVMQAYLYRAADDVADLASRHVPLRIVKGAYKEPREVAFPLKADVDQNYKKLVQRSLGAGNYTAIATHDEALIRFARDYTDREGIAPSQFEFQMLYGIRPALQQDLARAGYTVRVYVPFGTDWYGYFMRRLAERPANVAFVLRGMANR
ncbi:MAG: proline dehydrogenase [Firmicutes bacterium]|nr:proline dehydrogenase [Bacillota bacterium]